MPDSKTPRFRRQDILLGASLLVGVVVLAASVHHLRHDDAYITFRYARNLAEGSGLTFNPGERIFGMTSPLHALICAALYTIAGPSLPSLAVIWNVVALAVQAFLLYLLVRRELPMTAFALAALTFIGLGTPISHLALDTHTFTALLLATVWASAQRLPKTTGVLSGLTVLARYDAALLVPFLLFRHRRPGQQRSGLTLLATIALTTGPWLLFATVYYGWPMPQTLEAKKGTTPMGEYLSYYLENFLSFPGLPRELWFQIPAALLVLVGVIVALKRLPALRPLLGLSLALFLTYAWIGPPHGHHWHLYPVELVTRALIVLGVLAPLETRLAKTGKKAWKVALPAAVSLLLILVTVATVAHVRNLEESFWLNQRHRRYVEVSDWLLQQAGPNHSLLSTEVGTLGYLTDYEMLDPYGLVTPTVGDAQDIRHIVQLMYDHRPDLVLTESPTHGRFLEGVTPYRTVHVFPWGAPWSTLLVRDGGVLQEAGGSRTHADE